MQGRRFRVLAVMMGLVVALGGVAIAQGTDLFPSGDVDPPPVPIESIREVGPDVCGPLMSAFQTRTPTVELVTEYGLIADRAPAGLLGLGVRSFSCLSDNLAGRIEMIVLSLGRDAEVAQLVIPHKDMPDGAVRSYLAEAVPDGAISEVDSIDPRILLVTVDGADTTETRRQMIDSPPVPVWDAITQVSG